MFLHWLHHRFLLRHWALFWLRPQRPFCRRGGACGSGGCGQGGHAPLLPCDWLLAALLLPLTELQLEAAVVLVDVAPQCGRQGVQPLQGLTRLIIRVL